MPHTLACACGCIRFVQPHIMKFDRPEQTDARQFHLVVCIACASQYAFNHKNMRWDNITDGIQPDDLHFYNP